MKSKLVFSFMTVIFLSVVVAAALAQSFSQSAPHVEPDTAPQTSKGARAGRPAVEAHTLYSQFGQQGTAGPFYMHDARADTPESLALARRVEVLTAQLKDATSDVEREQKKTQLKDLLDAQFAARQQRHEKEISELETKVKKLKELVAKRQENRREIVANRLDQILRDSQGLGW
jgi:hypothetical protein